MLLYILRLSIDGTTHVDSDFLVDFFPKAFYIVNSQRNKMCLVSCIQLISILENVIDIDVIMSFVVLFSTYKLPKVLLF